MEKAIKEQLKRFGGNVRRLRVERQITQEKLSEMADLHIRTLQKIEAGQTNILVTTAARIQKALKCPLAGSDGDVNAVVAVGATTGR